MKKIALKLAAGVGCFAVVALVIYLLVYILALGALATTAIWLAYWVGRIHQIALRWWSDRVEARAFSAAATEEAEFVYARRDGLHRRQLGCSWTTFSGAGYAN